MEAFGYRWHFLISGLREERDMLSEERLQLFRSRVMKSKPQGLKSEGMRSETDHQWTRYCDTLTKPKSAIPRQRPGLLSRGVLFLDDNAKPTQQGTQKSTFVGWDGRYWITLPTALILPIRLLYFSRNEVSAFDITSKAMKMCSRLCRTSFDRWAPIFTKMSS
ncbi:hypothetical protein AVEN_1753-1 [Araneus ventricosus]|uniref:Uncharacterized protein n=1 Tax=Araneus ventricosus TaxID=182803 RepID=A0A4Y2MWJ7_ARAVE|nr:hypothetical protein AVEN_1753-1 [Araneus ventricosus]